MKFAKELEQELVPEWRIKYLDYKAGKKHVKAVARAVARANGSPRVPGLVRRGTNWNNTTYQPNNRSHLSQLCEADAGTEPAAPLRQSPAPLGADSRPESEESSEDQELKATTPMLMPGRRSANKDSGSNLHYGSFIATPPVSSRTAHPFELPGPAITPDIDGKPSPHDFDPSSPSTRPKTDPLQALQRNSSISPSNSAYEVGITAPSHRSTFNSASTNAPQPLPHLPSTTGGNSSSNPRAFMQRLLSSSRPTHTNVADVSLPAFDQVRARQKDFFHWMDSELDKIETFYKSKEDEARDRLKVLREQLHEMRNRRIDEIAEARKAKEIRKKDEHAALEPFGRRGHSSDMNGSHASDARDQLHAWIQPIERAIENAKARTRGPRPGANSKALQNMQASPALLPEYPTRHHHIESGRDYVRRPHFEHEIPYRAAKRKLKLAIKEYYRGLELLKSYALLNRTAFRKINKKYDKAINARPPLRYMSEKVNKAWFVESTVLEDYIQTVEDLYSRYFERGNHKVAVGKLRSSSARHRQFANNAFRSGLCVGTGAVFAIQALINAVDLLFCHPDLTVQIQTTYLLQIYGGYFLALYLFTWFCLDCSIWTRNKINYVFIFEFDTRHHLDWRELSEFPAFLLLVLGLFMWLNFSQFGAPEMFIYYPVILIIFTALVVFMPAPILYHRSRRWFIYSHWRLLLAGLYPVEFRDFFLGDMYCSLTFFMSNIELFFCLYANHWNDPPQCNSSHSRVLGFFSTLPGIWRALQCIRRYWDTRSIFPHLLNCGKYSMTIMYYLTLSLYRMQESSSRLALFITFAAINAVYCSTWDLAMDWSLCQPGAQKRFLRDVRGYKSTWPYYTAMIIDPILRFNWIFYVIYTHDLQHSSIAAFLIAFSEVSRRGMWTLFRVENEHCANVAHFKASRDVPLPYPLPPAQSDTFTNEHAASAVLDSEPQGTSSTATQASPQLSRHRSRTAAAEAGEAEPAAGPSSTSISGLRRRAPTRSLTRIFAEAHMQDFEKKRKPGGGAEGDRDRDGGGLSRHPTVSDFEGKVGSSDEDEEEDDDVDEDEMHPLDAASLMRRRGHRNNDDGRGEGRRDD